MRFLVAFVALASLVLSQPAVASRPEVGVVHNFGPDLRDSCNFPEGIAADPTGNVYASSLNFFAGSGPSAKICVLDRSGVLTRTISVAPGAAGVSRLLGMLFAPSEGLYVLDFADGAYPHGRVLLLDPATGGVRREVDAGNLYVSDSFRGSITRIAPDGAKTETSYGELLPDGFPPFGANGVAFDRNERFLYVPNTSNDKVYRIAFDHGSLGAIELFATGVAGGALDGPDGIAFDVNGNLYVCSNQSNEVAVLSPDGDVIAEYKGTGDNAFDGSASLVFRGRDLFVTDLSLFDGGLHQKLSVLTVPHPGAPLRP